jgi:outer membrane protein OmpA-like peptidoglycan-associated protein
MAVYDYLATHSHLKPQQLFVVGHGANHPVVSNGTPAGKERNRRVELVVYPEKMASR